MLATACLFALVGVAAVTDFTRHRIYNWTTYPGILIALLLSALTDRFAARGDGFEGESDRYLATIGVADCLAGFALCGGLMLVCYVFFRVGGGDVKLMAMLGAFLGPERGLESLLWTFVLAACLGIIALAFKVGPGTLVARLVRQGLCALRMGGWPALSTEERAQLSFPWFLAPTALAAVALMNFELLR